VDVAFPYNIFPDDDTFLPAERENAYRFATFARVARQLRSPIRFQVSNAWEMTRLPLSFFHLLPFLPSTVTDVWDPYVIIIFNLPPTNADGSTTTSSNAMRQQQRHAQLSRWGGLLCRSVGQVRV
jgi:hypothetical protein